jgi:hypothetical protein
MEDGPECRFPDFGPYAVRWNMAGLWEAVDRQRAERGQTWSDVCEATQYPDVESIRLQSYGIMMHDAMNVVRWLGRPAATFMYPAELSPARPGSAAYGGPEREEAERSAPNLDQVYRRATQGKTDEEIVEFARTHGGFPNICHLLMRMMRAVVTGADCEVGIDLGESMRWTFRRRDGRNSYVTRLSKTARAVVQASPADYMRMVYQDLDPGLAATDGRVHINGDVQQVVSIFHSCFLLAASEMFQAVPRGPASLGSRDASAAGVVADG